jgi:hypothetical protein
MICKSYSGGDLYYHGLFSGEISELSRMRKVLMDCTWKLSAQRFDHRQGTGLFFGVFLRENT